MSSVNNKHPDLMKFRITGDVQPPSGLPGIKSPAPAKTPSAPATPATKDSFEAGKKSGPPTIQDLRDGVANDPNFKKLSPGAQQDALTALGHMTDPKNIENFRKSLASPWLQKLKPDEQAKTVRSLALEHLSTLDKLEWKRKNIIDATRG